MNFWWVKREVFPGIWQEQKDTILGGVWPFFEYNEIQGPQRKNVLIDYERLRRLLETRPYDQLKSSHIGWVEEYLGDGAKTRRDEWTSSIAMGSRFFVEDVKAVLVFRAKVMGGGKGYQVRDRPALYNPLFGAKKEDIGPENTCL